MSWQTERTMTPRQFKAAIKSLGMTQAGAGRYLGLSERTARRYISGDAKPSAAEVLLLRSLIEHNEVPIVPKWHRDQT
jgi:DNA-binding transcriptional regulator YiaG